MSKNKQQIVLTPDKLSVRGPNMDGGYVLSLYLGEYQSEEVSQIIKLPQDVVKIVKIEVENA